MTQLPTLDKRATAEWSTSSATLEEACYGIMLDLGISLQKSFLNQHAVYVYVYVYIYIYTYIYIDTQIDGLALHCSCEYWSLNTVRDGMCVYDMQ